MNIAFKFAGHRTQISKAAEAVQKKHLHTTSVTRFRSTRKIESGGSICHKGINSIGKVSNLCQSSQKTSVENNFKVNSFYRSQTQSTHPYSMFSCNHIPIMEIPISMPVKLTLIGYHGCTKENAESILTKGIQNYIFTTKNIDEAKSYAGNDGIIFAIGCLHPQKATGEHLSTNDTFGRTCFTQKGIDDLGIQVIAHARTTEADEKLPKLNHSFADDLNSAMQFYGVIFGGIGLLLFIFSGNA